MLMHLGILSVVSFADLTFGMMMVHFFTFDPRWFGEKPRKGEKKVVAKLVSLNDDGLTLNYRDEFTFFLGFSDIKKANQEPEF